MIVHKFGGASIKDATSIENLASLIEDKITSGAVIVLSAIGKTTNALEKVTSAAFAENKVWRSSLRKIEEDHIAICRELFKTKNSIAEDEIHKIFTNLENFILQHINLNYNKFYDTVVSCGEDASTTIVYHFLKEKGIKLKKIMATETIITDASFREGKIQWEKTDTAVKKAFDDINGVYLTQGFIAGTVDGEVTTLGREGSDFSAAIIANILDAGEVRIWKDVDGLYNADPKIFPDAVLLPRVSYRECVELGYYGARVIHPRTILPLRRKKIPLYITSFINKDADGTIICSHNTEPVRIPCFIMKNNQCLITISPKDLGFMAEEYVEMIIGIFKDNGVRINLLQSSAVNLTICFDYDDYRFSPMRRELEIDFEIRYNKDLSLLTINNYTDECGTGYVDNKTIYLTQKSRKVIRFVYG